MKLLKGIGTGFCFVVLCLLVAPKAMANEQSSKTVVTFTVPVEVPGLSAQTLPAGTYLFKALESSPDRDIIQISNQDGTQVYATLLGVPNSRLKAPDLITVMFSDRPAADPQALKAWYCPGRIWGDQIVYEKPRALQLSKETNEPVLSTAVVMASSSVEVLKTAAIEAVNPAGETVAIAQVVDAPPVVAPALAVAPAPAVEATPNATSGSTVAVASSPAPETVTATEPAVSAGPAVVVAPPPAPEQTVAVAPATTQEPTAATEPAAATEPPATTDPAAASASTPAAEPAVAAAPVAALPPAVEMPPPATAAPVATVEPAVTAAPEVATATLPKTASVLPLIGLVGLLMLGAGLLMSGLMKRSA
jgi:hypothetical protein